jgi:hypothetical protein
MNPQTLPHQSSWTIYNKYVKAPWVNGLSYCLTLKLRKLRELNLYLKSILFIPFSCVNEFVSTYLSFAFPRIFLWLFWTNGSAIYNRTNDGPYVTTHCTFYSHVKANIDRRDRWNWSVAAKREIQHGRTQETWPEEVEKQHKYKKHKEWRSCFNWSILVARYLRASLTVTNSHIGGQTAEVRGGRGSDSAQGVLLSPCPFHISFPSFCNVAQARRYSASFTS